MVAAVRVHKVGGPEVLTYEEIEVPAPGPGQIRVKQHACGLNYIDTYFRMGMYPSPVGLPFVAGVVSSERTLGLLVLNWTPGHSVGGQPERSTVRSPPAVT